MNKLQCLAKHSNHSLVFEKNVFTLTFLVFLVCDFKQAVMCSIVRKFKEF